jgi:hypothetical protein
MTTIQTAREIVKNAAGFFSGKMPDISVPDLIFRAFIRFAGLSHDSNREPPPLYF